MEQERKPEIGEHVIYVDEHAGAHSALVTAVHGSKCVNLLFVVDDPEKRDPYGNQIERRSSCVHKTFQQAHGNYFRFADE